MSEETNFIGLSVRFAAKYVPLLAPFAAQRDIRYYLNGLRVEAAGDRPGVYLVACDGHRLTVAYDENGMIYGDESQGVILRMPRELIAACKKRVRGGPGDLQVVATGTRVSVSPGFGCQGGGFEQYVMPGMPWAPGKFPDWRKVLPNWAKLKRGIPKPVQAIYLADYARLTDPKARYYCSSAAVFWHENENGPVVVQIESRPEMVSIIMPIREAEMEHDEKLRRLNKIIDTTQRGAA